MIHRIDRVNPDVDDRVIKPNEARIAVNLRFGASTDDTNLSGGTLILGNKKIDSFVPPAGANKVVGVYADLESRNVFFAMYNSEGNHGLYRINGATNVVQTIAIGSWLNFQPEDTYNVSITGIDGKLYWTDGINSPRVINVQKGIDTILQTPNADVYPVTVEDWFYTQIKRPPGQPLSVTPMLEADLAAVSLTKQNRSVTDTGFQYSYYYVYDNNEESRLAPYSKNTFENFNVLLSIPESEFNTYTSVTNLIKAIVIVVRNGNDGVWKEIRYHKNDGLTRTFTFQNILASQKNTVASDIVDARFDSVPLISQTNEIAQNKINHANYRLDEIDADNFSITAQIVRTKDTDIYNITQYEYAKKSFVPWGRYSIGVEFVDNYGRTIPVTNVTEVTAPWWLAKVNTGGVEQGPSILLGESNTRAAVTPSIIDDVLYRTVCEYSLKGDIPNWVSRVNIVRSKCKNIVQFKQSMGRIYMWYKNQEDGNEFFLWVNYGLNEMISGNPQNYWPMDEIYDGGNSSTKYTFFGYAIEFNSFEPITAGDNQYVYLPIQYTGDLVNLNGLNNNNEVDVLVSRFKVHNVVGNMIFIRAADGVLTHPNINPTNPYTSRDHIITPYTIPVACFQTSVTIFGQASDVNNYIQLEYNFVITTEVSADEDVLYTTQDSYTADEYRTAIQNNGSLNGFLYGDAYTCLALKQSKSTKNAIKLFNPGQVNGQPIIIDAEQRVNVFGWYGFFTSMNPVDIYREQWNQDIGQQNTTNYKKNESRLLPSNICFSGNIIQGTQVNGLNKFNSLDFRQAPAENGPITSLVTTNATQREPGVLLAIGTFGISSFYYDAIQLTNVDGSNNVTTTDAYLASQRPLVGQYGTSRPMSVTKTPLGTVYWWSDVVNDLIRYSNAGLERLGNTFSFSNYLRKKYNDNPLLITWYDQVTDEINLLGRFQNTAVFSERYKTFQGERQYWKAGPTGPLYPQRAIGLPTKQYWFINGEIYVADVEANRVETPPNFIFDAFKNPSVQVVTNEAPSAVKRWNQVKVFGHRPVEVNLRAPIDNGGELVSSIFPEYFINRKGDWEAAIRRAENTTGGLLAGKLMESRIIYSNFAFSAEGFEKLNFIEVKSNVSIVQ